MISMKLCWFYVCLFSFGYLFAAYSGFYALGLFFCVACYIFHFLMTLSDNTHRKIHQQAVRQCFQNLFLGNYKVLK